MQVKLTKVAEKLKVRQIDLKKAGHVQVLDANLKKICPAILGWGYDFDSDTLRVQVASVQMPTTSEIPQGLDQFGEITEVIEHDSA